MRRSWLDWLLDTIDRIPGPRGAVYTGALVVWVAFVGIGGYLDQAIEAPWVSPGMALGVVLGLATLWAMQTLNGAAARAMTTLEPLLTVDADERARLYDAIARRGFLHRQFSRTRCEGHGPKFLGPIGLRHREAGRCRTHCG